MSYTKQNFKDGNRLTAAELNNIEDGISAIDARVGESTVAEQIATNLSTFRVYAGQSEGTTLGEFATAEGYSVESSGQYSHAEGVATKASGNGSHAEGENTVAQGRNSHAEGEGGPLPNTITNESTDDEIIAAWNAIYDEGETEPFTLAGGTASHAEGYSTLALGSFSHAEGGYTRVLGEGIAAHAEGYNTEASAYGSHAEGGGAVASGYYSHAEGGRTTASTYYAHAEGADTTASGKASHAEGYNTIASSNYQHVQGKYNIEDTTGTYVHIVGNGSSSNASNAHTLDWDGNAWFQGAIKVGGTGQNDETAKEVALKSEVAPAYTYGTEDLEPGVTALATGKLHFVYE